MPIARIMFSEFRPDRMDLENFDAATAVCLEYGAVTNFRPSRRNSYEPVPSFVPYSDALPEQVNGGTTALSQSGDVNVFAGTPGKLYRLLAGSTAFTNVSKAGGYSGAAEDNWRFAQFGDRVIACNYVNATQSFEIGVSTAFADLSASAPRAKYIDVVRDQVFLGYTFDIYDGARTSRVWWSGLNDPTTYATPGSALEAQVQSGFQDFPDAGAITGLAGNVAGADIVIFTERDVRRGVFIGPPLVYQFDKIQGTRGTQVPGAIVKSRGNVYFLADDGFYVTDGSSVRSIGGDKVDASFYQRYVRDRADLVTATEDPKSKNIYIAYPTQGSAVANRVLIYNYEHDRWGAAELGEVQALFQSYSFGYTLDTLDDVLPGGIDANSISVDSTLFTGKNLQLSAVGPGNRFGYFSGPAATSRFETGEFNFNGQKIFIRGVRPIIQGVEPIGESAAFMTRESQNGAMQIVTSAKGSDGWHWTRAHGRYFSARVEVPSGADWSQISGFEIDYVMDGGR